MEEASAGLKGSLSRVTKSYGRVLLKPDLFTSFYERFLKSSPKIKPKFENTNMEKQHALLRRGVSMVIMFAGGGKAAEGAITNIQRTHSVNNLNIEPELYGFWRKSLVDTIATFDPNFTEELREDWNRILQVGIDHIVAGYHVGTGSKVSVNS